MDPVGTTGDPGVRICQYSRTGSNHIDFLINGLPAGYYTLRLVLSTPMGKERSCEGGQVISFFSSYRNFKT
jgi:hypothetical protein